MPKRPSKINSIRQERGGLAGANGESYRKDIASLLALQLLSLDETAYLKIEDKGDDIVFFKTGIIHYLECKRLAPGGNWTWATIRDEKVSDFFIIKYLNNIRGKNPFVLILASMDGCKDLHHYCDIAKKESLRPHEIKDAIKQLEIPKEIGDICDFLKHLKVCTYSEFAAEFITSPFSVLVYDSTIVKEVQRFISVEGHKYGKITLQLLKEKIPEVADFIKRRDLATLREQESLNLGRFYRRAITISAVKYEVDELNNLYRINPNDFYNRVRLSLIAYNTNFKLIAALLNLFKKKIPVSQASANFLAANIAGNNLYQWHFLKDLNDPSWFPYIKDSLLEEVCSYEEDYSVKYLALSYLQILPAEYTQDVLKLFRIFEINTKYFRMKAELLKTIAHLKGAPESIWPILIKLAKDPHPWVRKEIPPAVTALSKFDFKRAINVLRELLMFKAEPQDVTQGSPTMALTFQGRDNENHTFDEAMEALAHLLASHPLEAFPLIADLEAAYIEQEGKQYHTNETERTFGKIIIDHSWVWYREENFETRYEYEPKKRMALEMEKALTALIKTDKNLAVKVISLLLGKRYDIFYLIVIKILTKTEGFRELKLGLIMNTDLWEIYGIREYYLQSLIRETFRVDRSGMAKFKMAVEKFEMQDKRFEVKAKQELLEALPLLADSKMEEKPFVKPFQIYTNWESDSPKIDELLPKSSAEITRLILGYKKSSLDLWHLGDSLKELAKSRPEIVLPVLKLLKNHKVAREVKGKFTAGYIEGVNNDLAKAIKLAPFLKNEDSWSRMDLIRAIHKGYMKANEIPESLLLKINKIIREFLKDPDPKPAEKIKTSKPRADDLLTTGINSVRGVAAESLIYYLFHFPHDQAAINLLKKISTDKSLAVQACIISEMRWLTGKGLYELTQEILNPFRNHRISGIDMTILRYLGGLDKEKLIANKELLVSLIASPDKEVQGHAAEFAASAFLAIPPTFEDIVQKVIDRNLGDLEARRSVAFIFEYRFEAIMKEKEELGKTVQNYLLKLVDPNLEPDVEVRDRAAFIFARKEVDEKHIKSFLENGFFEALGRDKLSAHGQSHAIDYLSRCSKNYLSEVILALKQILLKKDSPILGDHLTVQRIVPILEAALKRDNEITASEKQSLTAILDILLERGWDEAYRLFYQLLDGNPT